jgi:transposase
VDTSTEISGPLSVTTTPEGWMREPDEVTVMLRLHRLGWGTRRIAAALGCSRTTVQRCLSTGEWRPYQRSGRRHQLEPHMTWLADRFTRHRGNADVVRQDLARELGVTVSLRTIERAVAPLRQSLAAEARATVRFETPPGRQLQIDFGETQVAIGEETVRVHLFVATLGYSRRLFCRPFRHQRQSAWFAGMEASFRHFGGIPRDVLLDNPRALVDYHNVQTREVRFNAGFLAFARDWGFTPRACAPYRARTKGKDERGVGYVKHNAIAGHRFASWEALEAHLLAWTRDVADQRRHGTTEEAPRVRFDREEAPALQPLAGRASFLATRTVMRCVGSEGTVELDTNRYSVPWRLIGTVVRVEVRDGKVRIHDALTEVATHAEVSGRRQRVLQAAHYHAMPGAGRATAARPSHADQGVDVPQSSDPALLRPLAEYEALVGGGWS